MNIVPIRYVIVNLYTTCTRITVQCAQCTYVHSNFNPGCIYCNACTHTHAHNIIIHVCALYYSHYALPYYATCTRNNYAFTAVVTTVACSELRRRRRYTFAYYRRVFISFFLSFFIFFFYTIVSYNNSNARYSTTAVTSLANC